MLNYYPSYPGPEWLNSTTYWTGFAYSFYSIGSVGEYSLSGTSYNNQYGGGVRPVIILEK